MLYTLLFYFMHNSYSKKKCCGEFKNRNGG